MALRNGRRVVGDELWSKHHQMVKQTGMMAHEGLDDVALVPDHRNRDQSQISCSCPNP